MTYADRQTAARAAAIEAGKIRQLLADRFADALTKVTGDDWERVAAPRYEYDGDGEPNPVTFNRAQYWRPSDGFTLSIWMSRVYGQGDKVSASIDWPEPKERRNACRRLFRDAPGVSYREKEPRAAFDPSRKVDTVAKQVARVLCTDDTAAAFAAFIAQDAKAAQDRDAAATWRDQVARAAGAMFNMGGRDAGPVWWNVTDNRLSLESDAARPGGTLTVRLPDDPDAAVILIATIRAAMPAAAQEKDTAA